MKSSVPVVAPAAAFLPSLQNRKPYTLVLDLDETLVHSTAAPGSDPSAVKVRPGASEFLRTMSRLYEIVVFTAGTKDYADWALKFVDPENLMTHRLYREHAVQKGNIYVKDISRLGRDMRKIIIVDNVVENFQLQPENGIFVKSWEDDPKDDMLTRLVPILKQIAEQKVPDVRVALRHYRDYQIRSMLARCGKLPSTINKF